MTSSFSLSQHSAVTISCLPTAPLRLGLAPPTTRRYALFAGSPVTLLDGQFISEPNDPTLMPSLRDRVLR